MADSDAGTALTFMTSAQRNFNEVSTLVAEMLKRSKDARATLRSPPTTRGSTSRGWC